MKNLPEITPFPVEEKEVPSPKESAPRKAVLPDYPSGDDSSYAEG
jgi:hypothetical protein